VHILFVCSANKDRSKTAEDYFSEKYPDLVFESAGTNQKICHQYGTQFLTEDMLIAADLILVMENKHHQWIKTRFQLKTGKKIKVLSIPDVYIYQEKKLIRILDEKVDPIIKGLLNE